MASYGCLYRKKPRPAAVFGSEDSLASYLTRRKHSPRPAAISGSEDSFASYVYLAIEENPEQQLFLVERIGLQVLVKFLDRIKSQQQLFLRIIPLLLPGYRINRTATVSG